MNSRQTDERHIQGVGKKSEGKKNHLEDHGVDEKLIVK
jgi:hypothetical protein